MRTYKIWLELAEKLLGETSMTWTHEFSEAHEADDYLAMQVENFKENNYSVTKTGWYVVDSKPVQFPLFV